MAPNPRNPLEDYTIHCVDIEVGVHCDSLKFKNDKIFLSHNQGIYLYKDILAILSVQHQTIHIYQLDTGYLFSGDILSYCQAQKHCREISNLSMANLKSKSGLAKMLPPHEKGALYRSQITIEILEVRSYIENFIHQSVVKQHSFMLW